MISTPISCCRLCGSRQLDIVLDLGDQPPANSLRADVSLSLEHVPLVLCRCDSCTTIQLTETVSPDFLFRDYVWVTGTSKLARDYSYQFYENAMKRLGGQSVFAVEIASNDGTFLECFKLNNHRVLGVDPAKNLAKIAEESGIPTIDEFFGSELAQKLVRDYGKADIVIARNVLPHVPDPNDLINGMAHCLKEDGVGIIEFHWAYKIFAELHYDSIYHEHFFYHSLRSIKALLERHQLVMFDVIESPISGGSLVAYFSKARRSITLGLEAKLSLEDKQELAKLSSWKKFAQLSLDHSKQLRSMVEKEVDSGKKVIGYGASARSSTLLNFCGIDNRHLNCIADQSYLKHGLYTPGTDIIVESPDNALAKDPDTILLLAWNFRDEILGSLARAEFHGNVITPLPNFPHLMRV
jgi:SAM-dependent methyltransferase